MRNRWMAMAMLVLAGVAGPVAARAQRGPEDAARGFLGALDARRWNDAAALVLPGVALLHQRAQVSMVLAWEERRASGAPMSGTFGVAASDSIDSRLLRRFGARPVGAFGGARTVADLAQMTPATFMARTLENALTLPPNSCCAAFGRNQYVGTVVENDSVAHALYRELPTGAELHVRVRSEDAFRVSVLGLRREGGRWYVIPDWTLLSRGSAQASMAMAADAKP